MFIVYVLLAIVVLLIMIMIHEFGHYLAGKIFKFKIEEFSVGFGKPIFSKTMKSGEIFSLRWIPLGGFCAFRGEDEDEEETGEGAFNSYPCWQRIIVLISGALFNFISAILFTFVLLLSVGSGICQISEITSKNGNENIMKKGDIILEIDGVEPTFINGGISKFISEKGEGEEVVLTINRDGEIKDIKLVTYKGEKIVNKEVVKDKDGNPVMTTLIGVETQYVKYSFGEALISCIPYTFNMAWECLCILGDLITGQLGLENVGGPITTVQTIATSTQASMKNLLLLFPLISVNLAVFNLLPVPALDGARAIFVLIEWIFKKPVPRELEGKIHTVGLMLLFALVIIIDILQIVVF